ncbi:MAG: hypothetical protein EA381_20595 [Planctomycetaceae bacterium]|nr:MAG: hypothetical protein EA381_20595 [Planctomycetaceae bacterium]
MHPFTAQTSVDDVSVGIEPGEIRSVAHSICRGMFAGRDRPAWEVAVHWLIAGLITLTVSLATLGNGLALQPPDPVATDDSEPVADEPDPSEEGEKAENAEEGTEVDAQYDLSEAMTLEDALRQISAVSDVEFRHPLPEETPVMPLPGPTSFWRALDHVLDEASLDIDPYGGDAGTLRLRPSQSQRPRRTFSAAYAGIFRLEPTVVTNRRVLRHPVLSGLSVELEMAWQPGKTPISLSLPLDQIRGLLDSGEVLTGTGGATLDVATGRDIPLAIISVPLQAPLQQSEKIVELIGRLRMLLPVETHQFEFPLESATESQTVGSVQVRPEGVRLNEQLHEVRLGIEVDVPPEAMESHRGFLLDNGVYAVDATGRRAEHLGYQLYRQVKNGIGIAYLFDLGESAAGWKLVYESPTRIIREEVEFRIEQIPLP